MVLKLLDLVRPVYLDASIYEMVDATIDDDYWADKVKEKYVLKSKADHIL